MFALGSRAYPNFCAFGHYIQKVVKKLGGEEIYDLGEGNVLCEQEESFQKWALGCFKVWNIDRRIINIINILISKTFSKSS